MSHLSHTINLSELWPIFPVCTAPYKYRKVSVCARNDRPNDKVHDTIDSDIFRIIFSRISIKDIFAMFKNLRLGHDLHINDRSRNKTLAKISEFTVIHHKYLHLCHVIANNTTTILNNEKDMGSWLA